MEHRKIKESVKRTFDAVAQNYDENRHFVISAQKLVDLIDAGNPKHILDLSTGTGHIAIALARKFPGAEIHAVDISAEMLGIAKAKTREQGVPNITYYLQDAENLEFEEMEFDIITCGYGLFFYPDMDRVFSHVCSKLKNGGKFVFSTFTERAFQPYSQMMLDMLKSGYDIAPPARIEKRQLKNAAEIEALSAQVTYSDLKVHDADIRFPMDIDTWWRLLNTTGYSGLLCQLEAKSEAFEREYLAHLRLLHVNNTLEFNADSLISIVTL